MCTAEIRRESVITGTLAGHAESVRIKMVRLLEGAAGFGPDGHATADEGTGGRAGRRSPGRKYDDCRAPGGIMAPTAKTRHAAITEIECMR